MNADPKTVLTYLENHNVYKMDKHGDLALIHWRLKGTPAKITLPLYLKQVLRQELLVK